MSINSRSLIKLTFLSILLGLGLLIIRNYSFKYNDAIIYFVSVGIGVVLGIVSRLDYRYVVIPSVGFLISPLIAPGVFLPLTDYVISAIPILAMAGLIYYHKRLWSLIFPVVYFPVILAVIFHYFEILQFQLPNDETNLSEFAFAEISTGAGYQIPDDRDGYLLAYWHMGCGYCIRLEESLLKLERSNGGIQIVSVEAKGENNNQLKAYMEKWHPGFRNFQDSNRVVQNLTNINAGPILVIADHQKIIRHLYVGYNRNFNWFGSLYLNYKISRL